MKRLFFIVLTFLIFLQPCLAYSSLTKKYEEYSVARLLKAQVKYANKENLDGFISTYDSSYVNSDGFKLDEYALLVQDVWETFDNIKYKIQIKNIEITDNNAKVELKETSYGEVELTKKYEGEVKSEADSVYYLKKIDGKWKVVSDCILSETTSMLYGQAKDLDIKLSVPEQIEANKEYTASLEFTPPEETFAIASISSDIVEYPQKQLKEVFRTFPESNILERLFTSNNKNANEYVIASIGLTKTSINDLEIKLNLTGFGYKIKRVNVIPSTEETTNVEN